MSNLRRDMYKGGSTRTTQTTGYNNDEKTGNTNDDFNAVYLQRLNKLSVDDNVEFIEQRNNSLKSLLSRTESRQNSVLSNIIDIGDNSDRDNSDVSNKSNNLKLYGVNEIIKTLSASTRSSTRSGVGLLEKELLFSHLYRMIISSNSETYFGVNGPNDADFLDLINLSNEVDGNDQTPVENVLSFEWEAWIRCIVSYGCVGVDEVASEVVENVFPLLFKIIGKLDTLTANDIIEVIEYKKIDLSIWSLMSLVLFIYFDSENYGMLEYTKVFLNYLSNDAIKDENVVSSCLYMIGLSLSLAWESGRNVEDMIEDQVLEAAKLILVNKKSKNETKMIAAVVVGLCYEIIEFNKKNKEENEEEEEIEENEFINEEFEVIRSEIQTLANEGTKKVGKKGKAAKNIFREVLNTMDDENEASNELDSIAITKSKNLAVNSWFAYIRVQILRFVFGSELNNWLVKSKDVRNMLKINPKHASKTEYYENDENEELEDLTSENAGMNRLSINTKYDKSLDKERTIQINRERRVKEESM